MPDKIRIQRAEVRDIPNWLALAREVESLFGPMVDEPAFHHALQRAVNTGRAFCIRRAGYREQTAPYVPLGGGLLIDFESNAIAWLAVAKECRGQGYGRALVGHALKALDCRRPITVQTFARSATEGGTARRLYTSFGFRAGHAGGRNPAGIETVIMIREPSASG